MNEIEINQDFIKKFAEKLTSDVAKTKEFNKVINDLKQQVRKDTAKEILQDLYNQAKSTVWEAIEWTTDDIKQYAKKYRVEVDE